MNATVQQKPPEGRVALLFTDVEGSTAAWERYGGRFGAALQLHEAHVRAAISDHSGYVVKTAGDSFMAAFSRASDAAACAADIQRLLAQPHSEPEWAEVGGIRVRIGLHVGQPTLRDGDYFGPTVNRAARICDAAHGGMVLLSQEAAEAVSPALPPGVEQTDRGLHRLKDLGAAERLFELRIAGLPASATKPLRTLEALQHNFPGQVTSLVGRSRERGELNRLLARQDVRLVTLTGPGGTGKTRLAIQVAADRVQDFPGGIWLVELAATTDPNAVPAAVAMALGLELPPGVDARTKVLDHLRSRRALVVLDNFEQVADGARFLADALRECRELVLLVTSREILHLSGEHEYIVEPLGIPPRTKSDNHWDQYESVQLFVERAQSARPDFALSRDIAPAVGEICRRLDGIPLAIELAAARVRAMAAPQILQRLTHRFDLLSSSQRDLPERQRTLRNTIDWSYDLLSHDERGFFAELAIFADGCTLDAAEAVCRTPGPMDHLFSLRDKSLLKVHVVDGEARYTMLETIREYALERLAQTDALPDLRDRHRAFYLTQAESWNDKIAGGGEDAPVATRAFGADLANVRAAMDAAVQSESAPEVMRFAKAMFAFLRRQGLYQECDERLVLGEHAARTLGDQRSLARLLNQRALIPLDRSDFRAARPLLEASYRINADLHDQPRMLVSLINLGKAAWLGSDYAQARAFWTQGLELAQATGEARWEASLQEDLAMLDCQEGRFDAADRAYRRSYALHEQVGSLAGQASCLYNWSEVARKAGRLDVALQRVAESHRLFAQLEDRYWLALASVRLGVIHADRGEYEKARAQAESGLRIATEAGNRHAAMFGLDVLGRVELASSNFVRAAGLFKSSFDLGREVGDRRHMADAAAHYANVLSAEGRSSDASRVRDAVNEQYALLGVADGGSSEPSRSSRAGPEDMGEGADPLAAAMEAALCPAPTGDSGGGPPIGT